MTSTKQTALLKVEGVAPSDTVRLTGRCTFHPVRTELAGHDITTSSVEEIRWAKGNWVAETRNAFYLLDIDQELIDSIRTHRPTLFLTEH